MQDKIAYLKKSDFRLAVVIEKIGPIEIYKPKDPFSFLVSEVIGQLLSSQVREVIYNRFVDLCGGEVTTSAVINLDINDMTKCGMSLRKATCIKDIAQSVLDKTLIFDDLKSMTDRDVTNALMRIKGIGNWTAKMFLLFFLQREDILPYEDGAFMQSFKWLYGYKNPSTKTVISKCKKWSPYSSLASRYLYRALDTGLTRIPLGVFMTNI